MSSIDQDAAMAAAPRRSPRWHWPLMIGGPVLILAVVAWFVVTGGKSESTDDAYIQVGKAPISAAIAGRVVEIDVADNQRVRAGEVLFRLDSADEQTALERARANLATARLQVVTLQAAWAQQKLVQSSAQTTGVFNAREAARQRSLVAAGVASVQQAEQARQNADVASAQIAVARQQTAAALANLGAAAKSPDAFPAVLQAQAAVRSAQIALDRTAIHAPQDGVVARVDQLQVGAYVDTAQTVFFLLAGDPWVEANFKEDQLRKMRVGQRATIRIDAFGGGDLAGHVASFSPGSGSAFSALPAQNATGNWVKVVQRLPVRIAFDKPPPDAASRAGLSAKVTVDVRGAAARPPAAPSSTAPPSSAAGAGRS